MLSMGLINEHHTVKKYGHWRCSCTLALDGDEQSTSHPCHFNHSEIAIFTHCIGCRVDPKPRKSLVELLVKACKTKIVGVVSAFIRKD
jgi:ferredoxin-thioredoxin reductase catalytic subunit